MNRVLGIIRQLKRFQEGGLAAVVSADDEVHAAEAMCIQVADAAVSRDMCASYHSGSCACPQQLITSRRRRRGGGAGAAPDDAATQARPGPRRPGRGRRTW